MEEFRSFEFKPISASGLKDVRHLGTMKVYALVSDDRESPDSVFLTPVDKRGKTDPVWKNCGTEFFIPEKVLQEEEGGKVLISLYAKRTMGDKYVGEVSLSLKKLFDDGLTGENIERYVRRNDAKGTFGTLKFSYSFGKSTVNGDPNNIDIQKGPTTGKPRRVISTFRSALQFVETCFEAGEILEDLSNEGA